MHEKRNEPVVVFSGGGTGGHLYPALALADAVRRLRPEVRAYFVGAERGLEARVLPERGEEHILVPVEGFPRHEPAWKRLRAFVPLVRSLGAVLGLFRSIRPEAVVVTGGYAGGPAGLAAVILRIPLVVQEQNASPGIVTRFLARWARAVHIAFPESMDGLPPSARDAVTVSGNPVRAPSGMDDSTDESTSGSEAAARIEARRALGLDPDGPVVLVVGGSQGSAAINRAVAEAVSAVSAGRLSRSEGLQLLWATGPGHEGAVRSALERAGIDIGKGSWVHLTGYIEEMPSALRAADLAVSRAGAMATSEFLAWGLPSILIPLPSAAAGHQARNAEALDRAGAARCVFEESLDGSVLWAEILGLLEDEEALGAMAAAARERGRPRAADEIARDIIALFESGEAA